MDPKMPKNLLVTGPPGCGKTTLVRRIIGELGDLPMAGFYTEEIREGKERVGFALIGLDGRRGILSHVKIGGPHRVGSTVSISPVSIPSSILSISGTRGLV